MPFHIEISYHKDIPIIGIPFLHGYPSETIISSSLELFLSSRTPPYVYPKEIIGAELYRAL